MKEMVCSVCGYVYNEKDGIPEAGIAPGTTWEDLPDDWTCPLCGASKSEFHPAAAETAPETAADAPVFTVPLDQKELTPLEVSAVCSNLAKGCEKQYQAKESELFTQLADYFKKGAPAPEHTDFHELITLVDQDLESGFPAANAAAKDDRGARRALVWSEKVTRILKSLLQRYEKEGDAMLENTGVYVCTICGFIHIGATPPELCPVCKVPGWKFEKITQQEGKVSA